MKFASRLSRISISQTMAVNEKAIQLKEQGVDIVDFGAGEPDFPTPENVKAAAIRAVESNFTRYTAIGGTRDLRKAIVEKHAHDFGTRYEVAECIVNVGGKHAIFNLAQVLIEEGDDVVIPAPYWVSFADIARFSGANLVFAETRESDGFRLTADSVQQALTPKTRLIIINSPNNPSGAVLDDAEFVKIAALCRERGIWVLADECYSLFLYDGRKPFSIASHPEFRDNVVIAGSLSKTYAMTGWRIGFVLGPKDVVAAVQKLQSHSTSNPSSISQMAALEAVTGPQESVHQMLAEYATRRRFVVDRLRAIPGVQCAEPGGAFYAYPNISSVFGRGIRDCLEFSVRVLEEAHVAVVPGSAFGTAEHIRISYATSIAKLDEGVRRLEKFISQV